MRRLFLLLLCLILTVSVATAQDAPALSDYVRASAEFYAELNLSEDSLQLLGDTLEWLVPLSLPTSTPRSNIGDLTSSLPLSVIFPDALPDGVVLDDIRAWSGEQMAIAFVGFAVGGPTIIIPVSDSAGARAFAERIAVGTADITSNATLYPLADVTGLGGSGNVTSTMTAALTQEVMLIGSSTNVHSALQTVLSLNDHPDFNRVMTQLPDGMIRVYFGPALSDALLAPERLQIDNTTGSLLRSSLDAALRLHPAETQAETALLEGLEFDGLGVSLFSEGERLYLQAAVAIDASYPDESGSPTTRLWSYVPSESIAVLSAHDLTVPADAIIMLSQMNRYVSGIFDNIVTSIQNSGSPTLQPPEIPTAEHLLMLGRSALNTVFAAAGTDMDEFYEMVGGEYALALFPSIGGEEMRYALWIDTPDSERLLKFLETGATSFAEYRGLPAPQRQNAAGHPAFVAQLVPSLDMGVIALDENTVVITTIDDALNVVIGVVEGTVASLPTTLIYPVEAAGDIKVYAAPQGLVSLGMLPPIPLSLLGATFEPRADGVFVLTVMAQPKG